MIPEFCFICGSQVNVMEVKELECCNCNPAKLPTTEEGHLHCWNCQTWYCNGVIEVLGNTRKWHAENSLQYTVKDMERLSVLLKNDEMYGKSLSSSFLEVSIALRGREKEIKHKLDGD